jgi:hypothetical protein
MKPLEENRAYCITAVARSIEQIDSLSQKYFNISQNNKHMTITGFEPSKPNTYDGT